MSDTGSPARFRFPPLESRGVIAGWRGGQIASVALGLVVAVVFLRVLPVTVGALAGLVAVSLSVAVAFWPVGGRTLEQWLPVLVGWCRHAGMTMLVHRPSGATRRTPLMGRFVPIAEEPGRGRELTGGGSGRGRLHVVDRQQGPFAGISLLEAGDPDDPTAPPVGVVRDARAGTVTAVLLVASHHFALLGRRDQESRVLSWAQVLAGLAREGSPVYRLQFIQQLLPDPGAGIERYLSEHRVVGDDALAAVSYRQLLAENGTGTTRHRVLVSLTLRERAARWSPRQDGPEVTPALIVTLRREVSALRRALEAAEVEVAGTLSLGALLRVVGEHTAPSSAEGPAVAGTPWPMGVGVEWDALQTDETWHATYWIAEWPRTEVAPDFLAPLLFAPARRSLAVVMEPVPPSKAHRQVDHARTSDLADRELRRRAGFLATARQRRISESAEARDDELAAGHAQFRFSGYVTVTADSRAQLAEACAAIEQAAGHARLELRRLFGQQDEAYLCTLPLGRGLSS